MAQARLRSVIWDYFTKTPTGTPVCNTCKESPSLGSETTKHKNTSNLWSHLKNHHKELHSEALKKDAENEKQKKKTASQPTIEDMFEKQKKWPKSDERSKRFDKLILEMMVTDNQPFTVVSDSGFRRVMAAAEPRYSLKSEKYYRTEMLPKVNDKVVDKIKDLVKPENAGHSLAFTTDCWSGTTESLMSLTCHFIDQKWSRKQVVLNTKVMEGSHTGEYIKDVFLCMLDDWGINKDRVGLVLRDSGANVIKAMKLAELPHLSCTAHTLQLVVNDGLSSQRAVIDIIAMLKRCATHFHHSVLAKQRLRAIQKDLGLPEHNLIQAVPTRWNSQLHMLQRMFEQKRALSIYSSDHGGFPFPAAHQWEIVSNLIETLIPIEEVTLQVSHYESSVSCIIPSVTVLKMLLEDDGPMGQGIRTLRQVMRDSLVRRFSNVEETKPVVLACLLDPRYKNCAFSSDTTLTKAKEWLKEDIPEKEGEVETQTSQEEPATSEGGDPVEDEEQQASAQGPHKRQRTEQTPSRGRIDDMFQSLLGRHVGDPLEKEEDLDVELRHYLKEPVIDRRTGDPLQWWSQNEKHFKLLAPLARKYLCPPPSSVPSERVFSEVSAIYEKNRSRLTGNHAEQLCFLHHNLVLLNWEY